MEKPQPAQSISSPLFAATLAEPISFVDELQKSLPLRYSLFGALDSALKKIGTDQEHNQQQIEAISRDILLDCDKDEILLGDPDNPSYMISNEKTAFKIAFIKLLKPLIELNNPLENKDRIRIETNATKGIALFVSKREDKIVLFEEELHPKRGQCKLKKRIIELESAPLPKQKTDASGYLSRSTIFSDLATSNKQDSLRYSTRIPDPQHPPSSDIQDQPRRYQPENHHPYQRRLQQGGNYHHSHPPTAKPQEYPDSEEYDRDITQLKTQLLYPEWPQPAHEPSRFLPTFSQPNLPANERVPNDYEDV